MFFLQERFDCAKMFVGKKPEDRGTPQNFAVLYFHSARTEAPSRRCVYLLVSSKKCRFSNRLLVRNLKLWSSGWGSILFILRHSSNPSPDANSFSTSPPEKLRNL